MKSSFHSKWRRELQEFINFRRTYLTSEWPEAKLRLFDSFATAHPRVPLPEVIALWLQRDATRNPKTRYKHVRAGGVCSADDLDILLASRGPLSRLFRPLFALIRHSGQMAPLGFLFGLGFDTATEVTLLGLAAAQAADGVTMAAVVVFPALFAAGMALIDTTDGVLMLGAYEWAFVKPICKLYYNMTITAVSVLVAIVIGGIETTALLANKLDLKGTGWRAATTLAEHFNALGFAIIGLFAAAWSVSFFIYRWKRLDEIEVVTAQKGQP